MSNLRVSAHDVYGWVVGGWGGFFLGFGHDPDVDVLQHILCWNFQSSTTSLTEYLG